MKNILKEVELIKKEDIINILECEESLEVIEENKNGLLVYDNEDGKDIQITFIDNINYEWINNALYISPSIPTEYQINKDSLIKGLLSMIDKNTFLTLNKIVIAYNSKDMQYLIDYLDDDYAEDILYSRKDVPLGIMYFNYNCAIVNYKGIIDCINKEIEEDIKVLGYTTQSDKYEINKAFWETIVHELRHLLLETNPFATEEMYPYEMNSEENVEIYCKEFIIKNNNNICKDYYLLSK